jgi:hypothetical protein
VAGGGAKLLNIDFVFLGFRPENGHSIFLRYVGIYQQVNTALQPRTISTSPS